MQNIEAKHKKASCTSTKNVTAQPHQDKSVTKKAAPKGGF
jgi:hypothetical protein